MHSGYWGAGGAEICDIQILDSNLNRLRVIEKCGPVTVRIQCRALSEMQRPIVGFSLRNQRGIEIVSENTLMHGVQCESVARDTEFFAEFSFFLPYLAAGNYFIGGAVADWPEGAETHIQHHRRDDAIPLAVLSSHARFGIFSMPMETCRFILN